MVKNALGFKDNDFLFTFFLIVQYYILDTKRFLYMSYHIQLYMYTCQLWNYFLFLLVPPFSVKL